MEVWDKFADTTSKEGWENLVNMMVEELYNDYSGKFSQNELEKYEAEIRKLTLADFAKCENSECMNSGKKAFYGGFDDKPVTVAYQSYAKDSGLKYSDFGTVVIDNWEGAQFNKGDAFVFAGGYDAKRIAKNDMQGDITFVGNAVATVLNQDETTGTRVQNSKIYDGKAELNFNNGTETLKTTFDGWYDVNVVSNGNKNYDVTFSGGDKISDDDAKYFKYTTQNDDFTVKDFVQNPQTDYPYGAVDINYYGDNNIPSEASGYIAYGEKLQQGSGNSGIDLHAQIGFGAVKK